MRFYERCIAQLVRTLLVQSGKAKVWSELNFSALAEVQLVHCTHCQCKWTYVQHYTPREVHLKMKLSEHDLLTIIHRRKWNNAPLPPPCSAAVPYFLCSLVISLCHIATCIIENLRNILVRFALHFDMHVHAARSGNLGIFNTLYYVQFQQLATRLFTR
jgi:hypothetical protein